MILSACSDYFHSLFGATPNPYQHPIVILKDVTFEDLQVIVQFMYNGIVNVSSEKLPDILKVNSCSKIVPYCFKPLFFYHIKIKDYLKL